ncbi:hypothetical protein GpartN1_g6290.t1 [Galdieria partita]|uniref:J domain-containing protein n=1 Tax=Galdieria partita TaxID=83374 RepID=A0A9C7UST6_9RHOD|nr:hypothetical protein GpartN1_g6290.t1 [Galdieria partita]
MELSENYQQAKRCLERSRQYILERNETAARKFLEKAKRLCPGLKEIKQVEREFGEVLTKKASSEENKKKTEKGHPETCNGVDNERRREATEEQTTLVEHIKRQNNYYKILNIKEDASMEDIKRSFRKLAVKLHPDKNPCPGAEEAFKKAAKAFQALSDPVRRAEYDRSGVDTGEQRAIPRRRTSSRQGAPSAFFFDPFTGTFRERPFSGFHHTHFYTSEDFLFQFFRNFHASSAFEQEHSFGSRSSRGIPQTFFGKIFLMLSNIWPVLLILLFAYFSVPSAPAFQLYPDSRYSIERSTAHAGVVYYVKPSLQWDSLTPNELLKLEREVERSKLKELSEKCAIERQRYLEKNLPLFHTENHRRKLLQDFNSSNCYLFEHLYGILVMYG